MNLVSTLTAGIAAAPNGTAEVYERGTTTRATVYYTFEGATPDSSGADIDLDSYGSVEVYVNEFVDIIVKNADGVPVRTFTEGHSAPVVEVRSDSFTGIDYDTHAAAPGNPTTLQAVLDRWLTSAGATDFQVDIDGTSFDLSEAFGVLAGFAFNVKSPQYGAVGDGVTNDQAAIAACLADAVAAGGGAVFFPKGTYLVSSAIEWSHIVNMIGVGAGGSEIKTNSATNERILKWTAGTAAATPVTISGMAFSASLANTGEQLYATVAVNMLVKECLFGAASGSAGVLVNLSSGASRFTARDCRFSVNSGTNSAMTWSATSNVSLQRCRFVTTATSFTGALVKCNGLIDCITDCSFDISSVTAAATMYGVEQTGTGLLSVFRSSFDVSAQPFTACVKMLSGTICTVDGCSFGSSVWYTTTGTLDGRSRLQLASERTQSALTAFTVLAYSRVAGFRVTTSVPTITIPTPLFAGQEMTIIIENDTGGAFGGNVTYVGATKYGSVTTTAAASNAVVADFMAMAVNSGVVQWISISEKIGSA